MLVIASYNRWLNAFSVMNTGSHSHSSVHMNNVAKAHGVNVRGETTEFVFAAFVRIWKMQPKSTEMELFGQIGTIRSLLLWKLAFLYGLFRTAPSSRSGSSRWSKCRVRVVVFAIIHFVVCPLPKCFSRKEKGDGVKRDKHNENDIFIQSVSIRTNLIVFFFVFHLFNFVK